jgi:hypothetical protein
MNRFLVVLAAGLAFAATSHAQSMAKGVVFNDRNLNGKRDAGEAGIANIQVSNQRQVVKTNSKGAWSLPATDNTVFFVVKPSGWMTPLKGNGLPSFYYVHKPNGSPTNLKYKGVSPTGPLPLSINFPLHRQTEPSHYQALFFGDTQPRNVREVDYLTRDIINPLINETQLKNYRFGVTLGDVVFNDLDVYGPYVDAMKLINRPWYNVPGNHDTNQDVDQDGLSNETWNRWFGPNYYSFEWGRVHYVVLDDIYWYKDEAARTRKYEGRFGAEQVGWLKADLKSVPQDHLVVLMMHIPLDECRDKDEIYKVINSRKHIWSAAAHTHVQEHRFLKEGSLTHEHHHFVSVTACGSWWQGRPDDRGVPIATMRDGAPNGFSVLDFNRNQYSIEYRAAGYPTTKQMGISIPDVIDHTNAEYTDVVVNIFGGSSKSTVDMKFGENGAWRPMRRVLMLDPEYVKLFERDKSLQAPYIPLPNPEKSPHIWKLALPSGIKRGTQLLQIRTRDMFGHVYTGNRGVRVE